MGAVDGVGAAGLSSGVAYSPEMLAAHFARHMPVFCNNGPKIILIRRLSLNTPLNSANLQIHFIFNLCNQMTNALLLKKQADDLQFLKNKLELLEKLLHEKKTDVLVGIPTLDGFDFFFVREIIRCEGLQKCTRIVTTTKTDIISSYNIGEFRKMLERHQFFSPHKSHLINLGFILKYKREGTIVLRDNTCIPVSKRKKSEFLDLMLHL